MNTLPEAELSVSSLANPSPTPNVKPEISSPGRRKFFKKLGGAAGVAVAAGAITTLEPLIGGKRSQAFAEELGPLNDQQRADAAYNLRETVATNEHNLPVVSHPDNGDEALYADKGGSYSKCLPHDNYARVQLSAYTAFRNALSTGNPADFNAIPLGGTRTLTNPQSGLAYDLEGTDPHNFAVNPPPTMASPQLGAEMVEMYWGALLRDVGFINFASNPLAQQAAAELNALPGYTGPRNGGGQVTTNELFRGGFPGETVGPYVSQFLLLPAYFGNLPITQRYQTFLTTNGKGIEYLTDFNSFLLIQNGGSTGDSVVMDPYLRYIRNGRDFAAWTHVDVLYQAYFTAYLVLWSLNIPINPGNPYAGNPTQAGFGTFGGPDIAGTLTEVATRALKAVWFQKWFVHRRARPEVPGGLIHLTKTGQGANTDVVFDSSVLNSKALSKIWSAHGSYLLPQAFPEGSPSHPSYPTGHGTVGGACITVLKFFFDGVNGTINNPMMPNNAGTALVPYAGGPLNVNAELNKLGHNVTFGHGVHSGIHYRSDSDSSLLLGEAVALSVLQDRASTYNEPFSVNITKFDGTTATITNQN